MKIKFKFTKQHLYLLLTICMLLIFNNAKIFNNFPAGYSFAFALVANNYYSIVIILANFVCSFLLNLSFIGLVNSALATALLIIFHIVIKTQKKKHVVLLIIFCVLSRASNIYFSFINLTSLLLALLELLIGGVLCFVFDKIIYAILFKGIQALTKREKTGCQVLLILLFCGLTNINRVINVSKIVFIATILIGSNVLKTKTLSLACFIAIANLLVGTTSSIIITYFVIAFAASYISPFNKFLSASVVCLIDVVMGLYIQYTILDLAAVCVAALLFIIIPKKWAVNALHYLSGAKTTMLSAYYATKKQEQVKIKLSEMSLLFKQMQKCYRDLIVTNSSSQKAAELLAKDLSLQLCANCNNSAVCQTKNITACFEDLLIRAQNKKRVNLLDVPPLLSSNCNKINACISNINQMAAEYATAQQIAKDAEDNKLNISLQLGGTSEIFNELSKQFSNNAQISNKKSKHTLNCLQAAGITCTECVVTEGTSGINEIAMIVRNADVVNPQIYQVCEKLYNTAFEKQMCVQTNIAGWSLLSLAPQNRYKLVYGCATQAIDLSGKNGDNYVVNKLTDSKHLIAICDGMGHGDHANLISTLTINLIESYYKCGLSSNVVLDSVNSILLPASDSGFCTLDACIVDIISGQLDFIKIGSTISLIKSHDQTFIIDVESLPLGVTEKVYPSVKKQTIYAGDIIILVSDGIVDAFESPEQFCNFVNNENAINMQLFAEGILEEAEARSTTHKDDMTVIACRLMQKR